MRAAENASHSHILEAPDVDTVIISPLLMRNSAVTTTDQRATSDDDSAEHDRCALHFAAARHFW